MDDVDGRRLNEQRTVTEKLILVKKTIVGISEAVDRQELLRLTAVGAKLDQTAEGRAGEGSEDRLLIGNR